MKTNDKATPASFFDRFKERQQVYSRSNDQFNTEFIGLGLPTTDIVSGEAAHKAVVVSKQEQNEGYIYISREDEPLDIGSVWTAKEKLHYLIDSEIITIKNVGWRKYHAYLCNVQVADKGWGYLVSSKKSAISLNLKQNLLLESSQKPILVIGGQPFKFRDKFYIKDRAWQVDEYDNISTEGITYYTLSQTTIDKATEKDEVNSTGNTSVLDDIDNDGDEAVEVSFVSSAVKVNLFSKDGYFKADDRRYIRNLDTSSAKDTVSFYIRPNVQRVRIDTMGADGKTVVSYYYATMRKELDL